MPITAANCSKTRQGGCEGQFGYFLKEVAFQKYTDATCSTAATDVSPANNAIIPENIYSGLSKAKLDGISIDNQCGRFCIGDWNSHGFTNCSWDGNYSWGDGKLWIQRGMICMWW